MQLQSHQVNFINSLLAYSVTSVYYFFGLFAGSFFPLILRFPILLPKFQVVFSHLRKCHRESWLSILRYFSEAKILIQTFCFTCKIEEKVKMTRLTDESNSMRLIINFSFFSAFPRSASAFPRSASDFSYRAFQSSPPLGGPLGPMGLSESVGRNCLGYTMLKELKESYTFTNVCLGNFNFKVVAHSVWTKSKTCVRMSAMKFTWKRHTRDFLRIVFCYV